MKRKIAQHLIQWSQAKARKPLVVNGARQVGKTYSLRAFGRECFESLVDLDFYNLYLRCRIFFFHISFHFFILFLVATLKIFQNLIQNLFLVRFAEKSFKSFK